MIFTFIGLISQWGYKHIHQMITKQSLFYTSVDLVHWEDPEGSGGEGGGRGDRDGEHM